MRIDLVGTTADFRRFGHPQTLPINHLLCENRRTQGRMGEVGLAPVMQASRGNETLGRAASGVTLQAVGEPHPPLSAALEVSVCLSIKSSRAVPEAIFRDRHRTVRFPSL